VFLDYGEKNAPLLETIVESREQQPITTTDELKEVLAEIFT
jgi:16S rRNA (cytosine1402-N4)-methyltransferase